MMLLALIAYGIAAAFSALEKSTATVTAIAYEVGDGFQSTGFVARDEQVLKAPDGINVLLRDEGERVAKGEALAATFADEDAQETQRHIDELELELSRIESVLGTLSTTQGNAALDSQLQQALVDFTAQIVRGNLASAGQNANSLKATVLRRFLDEDGRTAMREQAQSLRGELASLRSRLAGAVTQSVAQRAGFFSGTTDELTDVGTNGHTGFGNQLDTVFGYSRNRRCINDFGVHTHLHGFEDVTSGEINRRSHLEGQIDTCFARRNEGVYDALDMSAGEVMRLQTIALDIRQTGLVRLNHTVHNLRRRHLTDTHQEELYETNVHTAHCSIDPQHEGHIIEENDQPDKDQGHHDDS